MRFPTSRGGEKLAPSKQFVAVLVDYFNVLCTYQCYVFDTFDLRDFIQ